MECFEPLWSAAEKELDCAAHDLSHVRRVYKMAQTLAHQEGDQANWRILGAAAILHDIARVREDQDPTRRIDHAVLGADMAYGLLLEQGWSADDAQRVSDCIRSHRFRGTGMASSLEAQLLYDADKLDCLGAVGIARSFMLAGQHGEPLYIAETSEQALRQNLTPDGRLQDFRRHAPNLEFEVKFRKVVSCLHTNSARTIGKARLALMESFFAALAQDVEEA